ncbi:MAG: kynureninase [Alphaproteobacteria bacterium]|nr:kynureninase [Alphaproteobacteria bacterium]
MTAPAQTRVAAERLDAADPLAPARADFALPDGLIYLDGNSLGALPHAAVARTRDVVEREWGDDLIRSWTKNRWIELPTRVGDKIARLIGAGAGEVVVADSTSVNLFKALAGALAMRPERRVILSVADNFPTDLYMAQGLIALLGGRHELRLVAAADIPGAIDATTAVVMLTHVNYRSGAVFDMKAITQSAHRAGALTIWDLAHSAGALPVDLAAAGADLAVGCGYKYLNGGPGAPAFLYVAERHQREFVQPLTGWLGHAAPFAFETGYRPAAGIARGICGTPPVLSLAALEIGVDGLLRFDMAAIRAKSLALGDLFIRRVEARCAGRGLALATPRDHGVRGSQVSFTHADGYPVMQALIARGVIGDFRAPDILRFGFTPLYLRYVDVWDAAEILADVLETRAWDRPEFHARAAVT